MDDAAYSVVEHALVNTACGVARLVYIQRYDNAPMYFREIYEVFMHNYPNWTALQFFPDKSHLFDQTNKYWLYAYTSPPAGFDFLG